MPYTTTSSLSCRAVFLSDLHLGTRETRIDFLLDFIQTVECCYLYLVGDIFDLWAMRRGVYWTRDHNALLQAVLAKAASGTRVVYIPGNHDELLRDYDGMRFGRISLQKEAVHTTADGRRLLVIHGDEFDSVVKCRSLGALIGNIAYDSLLRLSHFIYVCRRRLGFPYWSLSSYLKSRLPKAAEYIDRFDQAVAHEAKRRGLDGLICGHIHRASVNASDGFFYANTGDWVESCTALVEHRDGAMELVHWSDRRQRVEYRLPSAA